MLPEARKLLARAQALLGDGHLRREDFEVAEHSALTLTTICADGEVNVDGAYLFGQRARLSISRGHAAAAPVPCRSCGPRSCEHSPCLYADEKLETLRKIVYSGMERKMKDANAMQAS